MDSLLGVETDDERGNVDDLLSDSNVPLTNKDTSVMYRLGKSTSNQHFDTRTRRKRNPPELEHLSLQTTLQKVLSLQCQHVIESHALIIEHTDSDQSSNQGVTFEKSLGVFVVEFKEFSSGPSDLPAVICLIHATLCGPKRRPRLTLERVS